MAHTDLFTYFTVPDGVSYLLFSADEGWTRIVLQLETAGPVAVSTRQDVTPVLSGKGVLLAPSGEPQVFVIPHGDRLFIAAEAINRVKVTLEPIPFLEQILWQLEKGFQGLNGIFGAISRRFGGR